MCSLLSYALQRMRLQRCRVRLGVCHGFFHPLPLQQPSYVVVAVPGLCHHNIGWSNDEKQRLSLHVTQLSHTSHVTRQGRGKGEGFRAGRKEVSAKMEGGSSVDA
jgi:hypothetical protein